MIRTLGVPSAVVVGQGWGGHVGWAAAAAHPDCVSALCTVAAPHPSELLRTPLDDLFAQELVLVPARGVERWLSALADELAAR